MPKNYSNEKIEACYKERCVSAEGETAKALSWALLVGIVVVVSIGVAKALKG